MKQQKLSKRAAAYLKRIEACTDRSEIETIRKHKDGRWYGLGKARFTIEAEPYERFDYNF